MEKYEDQMILYQQAVVLQPPAMRVQLQLIPIPDEKDEPIIPPKPTRGTANAQAAAH